MAVAGEVTRSSPTPIQRPIINQGLSMSIDDENNNNYYGNGGEQHAHCVLSFIHSSPGAKVSASPYDLHTDTRKVSTSIKIIASKQFITIPIRNSTYGSFRGTVSLSVEHGWSSGQSSRIESGFSPDSFLSLYSDGGNHTRVFVVSYAHGRILSIAWTISTKHTNESHQG